MGDTSFIIGYEKFLKSLYIVGRGVLTPLVYEDPLYCLPTPFSNFAQAPPTFWSSLAPLPLFFLLSCFFGWVGDHTFDELSYLMMIWIYTCWALVPYYQKDLDVCFMQQVRGQVYWGLTCDVVFYWYSDLISHTNKQTNTQHTQGPVGWHTHILYIYSTCYVLTAAIFITLDD